MILAPDNEDVLHDALARAVADAESLLDRTEKGRGGHLRLFYSHTPAIGHAGMVELWVSPWVGGTSNVKSKGKYLVYAFEKAIRLAQCHPRLGHVSSEQSADPRNELWNGASMVLVKIPELATGSIWVMPSASGWPAKADAAIGLRMLQRIPQWKLDMGSVEQVLQVSNNHFAKKLLALPL